MDKDKKNRAEELQEELQKLRQKLRQAVSQLERTKERQGILPAGKQQELIKELRPAGVMLLCSCLVFTSVASYIPAGSAEKEEAAPVVSGERIQAEAVETEPEELPTESETESAAEEPEEYEPAPYLLNLAYQYPEGSETSYAETLMRELIQKDAKWYAEIYDMANTAPATIAARLGLSASSVLGKYNPASQTQNASDASTWAVEHFKNVRVSFYNGDGAITSAVSNAQDIISMASVYAYYNGIEDIDQIRNYMNALWTASHSYSVSMGSVYYCEGCVSTDQASQGESTDDEELEGEDSFSSNRTIDTEITTTDETVSEQNAEEYGVSFYDGTSSGSGNSNLTGNRNAGSTGNTGNTGSTGNSAGNSAALTESTTHAAIIANSSAAERESTTSALQSLAETAESVYIEESTKAKTTIVRIQPTTAETEETTRFVWNPETERSKVLRGEETAESAAAETQASETAAETAAETSQAADNSEADAETMAETSLVSFLPEDSQDGADTADAVWSHEIHAAALSMDDGSGATAAPVPEAAAETTGTQTQAENAAGAQTAAGNTAAAEQTSAGNTAAEQAGAGNTAASQTQTDTAAATAATTAQTSGAAASQTSAGSSGQDSGAVSAASGKTTSTGSTTGSSNMVCPGHVDLKITAKIYSLSDAAGLYSLDQKGNTVEEGGAWPGWTDRCKAFVKHINRQDWVSMYNLNITIESTSTPLTDTEIESYMKLLPEDTSEVRKEIIRFALQSVGKVPYYWGGKASARNYSGNNFGSVVIPDHRGRILRGLDCSGWIGWVYWTVTGNRLPYEGTDGLRTLGRQVARQDLKPGDIIVITGDTPHVIMFLSWTSDGQILCIHETGSANNVTVGTKTANWPYYRNLLD